MHGISRRLQIAQSRSHSYTLGPIGWWGMGVWIRVQGPKYEVSTRNHASVGILMRQPQITSISHFGPRRQGSTGLGCPLSALLDTCTSLVSCPYPSPTTYSLVVFTLSLKSLRVGLATHIRVKPPHAPKVGPSVCPKL